MRYAWLVLALLLIVATTSVVLAQALHWSQGQSYGVFQGEFAGWSQGQAYAILTPTLAVSQQQTYAVLNCTHLVGTVCVSSGAASGLLLLGVGQ
jgi:hypothetical protein